MRTEEVRISGPVKYQETQLPFRHGRLVNMTTTIPPWYPMPILGSGNTLVYISNGHKGLETLRHAQESSIVPGLAHEL